MRKKVKKKKFREIQQTTELYSSGECFNFHSGKEKKKKSYFNDEKKKRKTLSHTITGSKITVFYDNIIRVRR
jgi:seryl-tRNA synthetase